MSVFCSEITILIRLYQRGICKLVINGFIIIAVIMSFQFYAYIGSTELWRQNLKLGFLITKRIDIYPLKNQLNLS